MAAIQSEITSAEDIEQLISDNTQPTGNPLTAAFQNKADMTESVVREGDTERSARHEDDVTAAERREDEELDIYEDEGSGTEKDTEKELRLLDRIRSDILPTESLDTQTDITNAPSLQNDPSLSVAGLTNQRSANTRITNQRPARRLHRVKTTPVIKTAQTPPIVSVDERQCRSAFMDKKIEKELKLSQMQFVGVNTRVKPPSYDLRESPLITGGDHSRLFKSVYLYQNRPTPMNPLKAWKGYNGNIYFNPIKINRVDSASKSNTQNLLQQKLQLENSRRKTGNNLTYIHCDPPPRPTHLHLDKQSINSWKNKNGHDDVEYIMSREDIGSLMVEKGRGNRSKDAHRLSLQNVQKGSVAHRLASEKEESTSNSKPTKSSPGMNVAGDRLKQYRVNPNPLVKVTVQFSQSVNRPKTNSPVPEMFNKTVAFDKMPPLEQFRASLKNMNSNSKTANKVSSTPRIVTEKPPHVKFSREHQIKS